MVPLREQVMIICVLVCGIGGPGGHALPGDEAALSTKFTTEPDPPHDLSIEVLSTKEVHLSWGAPQRGHVSSYKVTLIPLTEPEGKLREFSVAATETQLRVQDLTPGASYEVQLQSIFIEKASSLWLSANFTTKPAASGRFIVWFRNETALLVLWQPPYPAGVFDQYRVSITPEDAIHSVLFVEKESDPPGPAQAEFYGLLPGRAYNISVQTVSNGQLSQPTEATYRTVPLPPQNVTFDRNTVTPFSFDIRWDPPKSQTEYDRYQVAIGPKSSSIPKVVLRNAERIAHFDEELEPGKTYEVLVKTVSGNVASWPASGNVTTRPLPVQELKAKSHKPGEIHMEWIPNNKSIQDSYLIKYHDVDSFTGSDGSIQVVHETSVDLRNLLAGRNYSIRVVAVCKGIVSEDATTWQATRPASPVIGVIEVAGPTALNVSWKSDVTSRQDSYQVLWTRNDTRNKKEAVTKNNWMLLENLYPGAGYEISVAAISYGLKSVPHSYFQTLHPRPPENLKPKPNQSNHTSGTMAIQWLRPLDSLVDHYVIRYRPVDTTFWREFGAVNGTEVELRDLEAGQRYVVRVSSVSNRIESLDIREIEITLRPNPVRNIDFDLDSHNVTATWQVPYGRVDYYLIEYHAVRDPVGTKGQRRVSVENNTRPGQRVQETIGGLKPGELYQFYFATVSYSETSVKYGKEVRTMPVIDSLITVIDESPHRKAFSVKYSPTPLQSAAFDLYRFSISDPAQVPKDKLRNDTDRLVVFDNLVPGRLYNISIVTISGGVASVPIVRQARLRPEPIAAISALSITDTEIQLAWDAPSGDKDAYEVKYFDPVANRLVTNITLEGRVTYRHLKPHHNYTFEFTTLAGYGTITMVRSTLLTHTFTTLESIPGKVSYFQTIELKPNEITFQWSLPPDAQNGVLTRFTISYYSKDHHSGSPPKSQHFDPTESQGTIYNLNPGETYVFIIQALTKVGPGSKAQLEQTMPIWAPPVPLPNVYPTEVGHSSTTIKIRFRKNFFAHNYGTVRWYTVIVTEDDSKPADVLEMPSWYDVHDLDYWPPYQVAEPYYPFNNSVTDDFMIGDEDCSSKSAKSGRYCNGPLKPGSTYKFKLRAFTTPTKFTDTVWSYGVTTDPDNTALYIGIFIPLSLILALVLTVLVLRWKGIQIPPKPAGQGPGDFPLPQIQPFRRPPPIPLRSFPYHYKIMSADSDFRFSEEFELFNELGRRHTTAQAELPGNRPKNRFTNILPFDHSRVKLSPTDDDESSDYINANWVPGFNSRREFIVTQGPLHSTRDDFWRMVWECNSRAIIMLTRCVEKGREKCDRYWPEDSEPMMYGDIEVTMLNETRLNDWNYTELRVRRDDQIRVAKHFHFTTWPDFGVPDPPVTLVRFVRFFREKCLPSSNHPIVVHCSAGVGRSGTFVALDRILQHIKHHDYVDIFGIVLDMREQRAYMVQNEQQYICIHQCLLAVINGEETSPSYGQQPGGNNQGFEDDEGIQEGPP